MGFTLAEIMISVVIVSVITLGMASAITDLMKAQMTVADKDDSNQFGVAIGRYLYTTEFCTSSLKETVLPVGATSNALAITNYLGFGATSATGDTIAANSLVGRRVRVKNLTIKNKGIPPRAITLQEAGGPINYQLYIAQVELLMERQTESDWTPERPRYFEFPVMINPLTGNKIVRCAVSAKNLDFCSVQGASVKTLPSGQEICAPAGVQCIARGAFATNTCVPNIGAACPTGVVNPITGTASCPPPLDTPTAAPFPPTKTGQMQTAFTISCGKKCTTDVNMTTEYFMCQECN